MGQLGRSRKLRALLLAVVVGGCDESLGASDGGVQSTCVPPGTAVATSPREFAPIEQLKVGDHVLSYDPVSETLERSTVVQTFVHEVDVDLVVIEDKVSTSPDHPIYSDGQWIPARDLTLGSALVWHGPSIHTDELRTKGRRRWRGSVHNIEVVPHRNYFANGLLVHNKSDRAASTWDVAAVRNEDADLSDGPDAKVD